MIINTHDLWVYIENTLKIESTRIFSIINNNYVTLINAINHINCNY